VELKYRLNLSDDELADLWRTRLQEATRRLDSVDSPSERAAARKEYLRVLRIFADLVMRNKVPEQPE
jgi:hypothetical protein